MMQTVNAPLISLMTLMAALALSACDPINSKPGSDASVDAKVDGGSATDARTDAGLPPGFCRDGVADASTTKPTPDTCVPAGCSGQFCVPFSESHFATTCEYREEYRCLKCATCERQADGNCGWTRTQAQVECEANPK